MSPEIEGWVEIPHSSFVMAYHPPVTIDIRIRRLPHGKGLPLPSYATDGAAGADLCAAVASELVLEPGERMAVPTGLVLEIPSGYEGQVRPRSGLAIRHGLTVVNTPGTIDSDYRGEVLVTMYLFGALDSHTIRQGDRIAQLVIGRWADLPVVEVETLSETERGPGGHGSTGL